MELNLSSHDYIEEVRTNLDTLVTEARNYPGSYILITPAGPPYVYDAVLMDEYGQEIEL